MTLRSAAPIVFAALAVFASVRADVVLLTGYPFAVDLEIPLRAAERWLAGEMVYPPSAFEVSGGPGLPFLYPPFVLPFLAPLTWLPREPLAVVWVAACALIAVWAGRRLGLRWPWAVAVLIWPPFLEGILGGNVQILLLAAFAALIWRRGVPLDLRRSGRPAVVDGGLAAAVAAVKVAHVHAWLFLLRWRPRAALVGLGLAAAVALVTLPLVGLATWFDWLGQADRASDPAWQAIGQPLSTFLGRPVALAVTVASVLLAVSLRGRHAGAWIGILMIVGAPSLHMFQLLLLLPAMLAVRREVAFVAAFMVATYQGPAIWLAVVLVAAALWGSGRWPALRVDESRAEAYVATDADAGAPPVPNPG